MIGRNTLMHCLSSFIACFHLHFICAIRSAFVHCLNNDDLWVGDSYSRISRKLSQRDGVNFVGCISGNNTASDRERLVRHRAAIFRSRKKITVSLDTKTNKRKRSGPWQGWRRPLADCLFCEQLRVGEVSSCRRRFCVFNLNSVIVDRPHSWFFASANLHPRKKSTRETRTRRKRKRRKNGTMGRREDGRTRERGTSAEVANGWLLTVRRTEVDESRWKPGSRNSGRGWWNWGWGAARGCRIGDELRLQQGGK